MIIKAITDIILKRVGREAVPVHWDTNLTDDLNLDSVELISIILELEEEFQIVFEEADFQLANFRTLGTTAELVRKRLAPTRAEAELSEGVNSR